MVYIPKTYEASCKLGRGTNWCTATTSSSSYYDQYSENGNLYVVFVKDGHEEATGDSKYQFHFESGQFMDSADKAIPIFSFLEVYSGLREFFTNEANKQLSRNLSSIKCYAYCCFCDDSYRTDRVICWALNYWRDYDKFFLDYRDWETENKIGRAHV